MAIEKRAFGRTGHRSTAVIFGGAALSRGDEAMADRALDILLEHGINHLDTAAAYGEAERLMGPWMDRHRDAFFLASKTGDRDHAGARDSIRRSLDLLRTDHLDLIQLHALHHPDEWEKALGPGGALEAAIEAREEGLARFIGVTGHGWTIAAMHRRSLERFAFDSVLMPWNPFVAENETYARDFEATAALCAERGVAVQTIKSLARGPWAAGVARTRNTWYQPLEDDDDIRTAVDWVLGRPEIFLITAGDIDLLPRVLKAASEREDGAPMPDTPAVEAFRERAGLASIFGI